MDVCLVTFFIIRVISFSIKGRFVYVAGVTGIAAAPQVLLGFFRSCLINLMQFCAAASFSSGSPQHETLLSCCCSDNDYLGAD